MNRLACALPLLFAAATLQAQDLQPGDFTWRATLDTAAQRGLVRLPLSAEALMQLQTRNAADLRLFDAQSQPVAFALATAPDVPPQPRERTAPLRALPLHGAEPGARLPKGALQLRVDNSGQRQSVWVQLGGEAAPANVAARRLPAALFDTRGLKQAITALAVQASLPANVPVRFTLSTSSDLENWTTVAAAGRLYRFDGEGAPANDLLELSQPLRLENQYLRLDWAGQQGVEVASVTGLLAAVKPERPHPLAALPAGQADGPAALEWQLGFATPIARLEIATERPDTLIPLRILGRNQVSEPWRVVGQSVLYRLGPAGQESLSPPTQLQHPSLRLLRVEATHGLRLQGVPLAVRVHFEPVELVFVAGGQGPYQLAAGRPATASVALPLGMLAATTQSRIEDLPLARIGQVQSGPAQPPPAWARWLPRGVDTRSAGLWAVLLAGVLLLGAAAWSLLRQLRRAGPPEG